VQIPAFYTGMHVIVWFCSRVSISTSGRDRVIFNCPIWNTTIRVEIRSRFGICQFPPAFVASLPAVMVKAIGGSPALSHRSGFL